MTKKELATTKPKLLDRSMVKVKQFLQSPVVRVVNRVSGDIAGVIGDLVIGNPLNANYQKRRLIRRETNSISKWDLIDGQKATILVNGGVFIVSGAVDLLVAPFLLPVTVASGLGFFLGICRGIAGEASYDESHYRTVAKLESRAEKLRDIRDEKQADEKRRKDAESRLSLQQKLKSL